MKNVLIFITHSMGEFDVLFPLFGGVKEKYDVNVEIVFAVKEIYRQFVSNDFYKYCANKLNIKITYYRLPNKFDPAFRKMSSRRYLRMLLRIYFFIQIFVKLPFLLKKLSSADVYMHEFSNQLASTRPLYWAKRIFAKKIFCYIHGHAINLYAAVRREVKYADKVTLLSFHEHNRNTMSKLGFENQYIIGYPKFYEEWENLVKAYPLGNFRRKKIVVIYSRHVHPFYMDKVNYVKLLVSSCAVIREKMENMPIVIKPHPREKTDFIEKILKKEGIKNYFFSYEDASLLALNAELAISFWTSAILASLAFGVPSVEYYIEAERFREMEPEGSVYKKLGIDSVSNAIDLSIFFERVLAGKYQVPNVVNEISKTKDFDFLNFI